MKITLFFSFIFCISALIAQPLNYSWHRSDDASGGGRVLDVAGVHDGIISYTNHGSLDVDPSYVDHIVSTGSSIIKYDNQKRFKWVLTFPNLQAKGSLLVDSLHNAIYAYGSFNNSFDTDPGPGTNTVTANQSGSYLIKIDLNGNHQWTYTWTGQQNELTDIDIDENGTVYLLGQFKRTLDFDPTPGVDLYTSPVIGGISTSSLFLIKLNNEGGYVGGFRLGVQPGETNQFSVRETNSLKVKGENVFFGTNVHGEFDVDAGINETIVGTENQQSLYIIKYDTSLVYQDVFRIKHTRQENFHFTTGYQDYLAITASGNFTFNTSVGDTTVSAHMILLLLDENFNFHWSAKISPSNSFSSFWMSPSNIEFSENGHIFITGGLRGTHNVNLTGGTDNLINGGSEQEAYILQYDINKNLISANLFEHIGNVSYNYKEGLGLYKNKVLIGLGVSGKFDIDFGLNTLEITLTGTKPLLVEYLTCIPDRVTVYDTICDGETYFLGNQIIRASGKYTHSFVNQNGCDSIVTSHLTVRQLNTGTDLSNYGVLSCINTTYSTYQWIRCDDNSPVPGANSHSFSPSNDDLYKVIISNGTGCTDTSNCFRITNYNVNGNPTLEWATTIHKVHWGSESSITTDLDGNFYIIGTMWNKLNVELFGGTTEVYQSPNSDDLIIAKYTKDGALLWAYPAGIQGNSAYQEQGASIAVDPEGNVYAAGTFVVTFDIDPDEYNVVEQKHTDPSCCNFEAFLIKINPNGQLIWNKTIGGIAPHISIYDIALNSKSDIVICGGNISGPIDFDPGAGQHILPGKGFAALYSKDGDFINVIEVKGGNNSFLGVHAGKFDINDNLIIAGSYGLNTDFDIGPGVTMLTTSGTGNDLNASFIASYDANLNLNWAKKLHENSQSNRKITSLAVDKKGNAFLAGSLYGSYIRKYSPTGTFQTFPLSVDVDADISLAVDRYNNLLVSGKTFFPVNIGGGVTLPMNTDPGAFFVKYSNTGTRRWAFMVKDNVYNQLRKGNLATDEAGNFYYLGTYAETLPPFDIDPSDSVFMIQPKSAYIAKFGEGCETINTNYNITNDTEVSVQNGGYYQLKRCSTSEIIKEGFNNTFSVCESDDYYIIIKKGECFDSTDCFSLSAIENNLNTTISLNVSEVTVCDLIQLEISSSNLLCNSIYDWSVNGSSIQLNSPSYSHILTSERDSIIGMIIIGSDTLFTDYAIVISGQSNNTIDTVVCGTYIAPSGINYTSTGVYFDTIPSSIGCDSTFIIDLTIQQPTLLIIDTTVCDTYISPLGQVYQSTGTYNEIISSGICDSIYTINLLVNEFDLTLNVDQHTITSNQQNGTFQWFDCENASEISGATSNSFIAPESGSYAVILYNNNCTDTSNCVAIYNLTIQNINEAPIIISPNPVTENMKITNIPFSATISIKSMSGSLIRSIPTTSNTYIMDVSYLSNGVYLLEVNSENKNTTIKFIKQ